MNPRQLHAEMNRFRHVLSDLAPDVREAIEEHDGRLIAAILDLHRDNEDLSRRNSSLHERELAALKELDRVHALYAETLLRLTVSQRRLAAMFYLGSLN